MRSRWAIVRRRRVVPVVAVALVLPCLARAERESVHIDYAAPAGCPDATAFLTALRLRTTRFREAAAGEPARGFRVRVLGSKLAFSGALEIRHLDGTTAIRSVDATVCDEVANALALMTALAIDPDALTSKPAPGAQDVAEPPAEQRVDAAEAEDATTRLVWPPPTAPAPRPGPASAPWRWSAGLHGHLTLLLTPGLGYGGDAFVDAEAPASSALGPALRLSVFLNRSDVELASGAVARFQWAAAGLEACPARLRTLEGRVALDPCVAFRLGGLQGEGRQMREPKRSLSLWSDAGLTLRLRVAATEHLVVEAQGQLMLPLHRPRFEVTDDFTPQQAYAVPSLGLATGIGAGYRF